MDCRARNLIAVSPARLWGGDSAAAVRMTHMARALAGEGVNVYLASLPLLRPQGAEGPRTREFDQAFETVAPRIRVAQAAANPVRSRWAAARRLAAIADVGRTAESLLRLVRFARSLPGRTAWYVVPTPEFLAEWSSLAVLKGAGGKVFREVCEHWPATLPNRVPDAELLRGLYARYAAARDHAGFAVSEQLARFYDGLVVISTALERRGAAMNPRVLRVPILCDANEFPPVVRPPRVRNGRVRLGFAGWIAARKEGFDLVYQALSLVAGKHPGVELHLWGPVPRGERNLVLDELPGRHRVSGRVEYHGAVSRADLQSELRRCHLLLLPRPSTAQTEHGFSTKLAEYLCTGIPVLATAVSDNSLYLKDGRDAFLVAAGDPAAMANRLIEIIETYDRLAPRVAAAGLQTARRHFHFARWGAPLARFFFGSEDD